MGYTVPNDLPRKGNERMVIPMKKMLAMLLAVLTLCFGAAAMAESVPEVDDAAEQAALTDLTANGQLIEGWHVTFKDGKVVEHGAEKNASLLAELLSTDENACRIGEIDGKKVGCKDEKTFARIRDGYQREMKKEAGI